MSSKPKTRRDLILIVATLVPPLTLLLIGSLAAAKWQTTQPEIRAAFASAVGEELLDAPSPLAANYRQELSDEKTVEYRELLAALDVINDQYAGIDNLVEDDERFFQLDEERPSTPFLKSYLNEVKPVLEQFQKLGDLSKIWQPTEFDNPHSYRSGLVHSTGVPQVLRLEFIAGVRDRDAERALNAIKLGDHLGVEFSGPAEDRPLIAQSVALGTWNESQLDELERLLAKRDDFQKQWIRSTTGSLLDKSRWLLKGEEVEYWRPNVTPTTYAPSTRLRWIERAKRYENVRGIGSMRGVRETLKLEKELRDEARSQIDTAIQIPSYAQYKSNLNYSYLAIRYAQLSNVKRWTRTAIAVAKYKLQNGTYPESLNDLADIGFDLNLTLDPLDRPFQYQRGDDIVTLANASRSFTTRMGSWTSLQSDDDSLSSVLKRYRVLGFQPDTDAQESPE